MMKWIFCVLLFASASVQAQYQPRYLTPDITGTVSFSGSGALLNPPISRPSGLSNNSGAVSYNDSTWATSTPSVYSSVLSATRVNSGPLITLGAAGAFDAGSLRSPRIFWARGKYWITYEAWPTNSNPQYASIGLASSVDGTTWTKHGAIIVPDTTVGAWSYGTASNGGVYYDVAADTLYVYITGAYARGQLYSGPLNVGVAYSSGDWTNPASWTRSASPLLVKDQTWEGTQGVYQAGVVKSGTNYVMLYSTNSSGYGMGIATGTSPTGPFTKITTGSAAITGHGIEECMPFWHKGALCFVADETAGGTYGLMLYTTANPTGTAGWTRKNTLFSLPGSTSAWDYTVSGPGSVFEKQDGSGKLLVAYAAGLTGTAGDPPRQIGILEAEIATAPNIATPLVDSFVFNSGTVATRPVVANADNHNFYGDIIAAGNGRLWMQNISGNPGYKGMVVQWYGGQLQFIRASDDLQSGPVMCGYDTAASKWFSAGNVSTGTGYGYVGTGTNDNAPTGCIGQYITAYTTQASPVVLTSGSPKTITSIGLPAGDWDVTGQVDYTLVSGTITYMQQGYSLTTNTLFAQDQGTTVYLNAAPTADPGNSILPLRYSLASGTTVYLIGNAVFTGSVNAYGTIRARRVR